MRIYFNFIMVKKLRSVIFVDIIKKLIQFYVFCVNFAGQRENVREASC